MNSANLESAIARAGAHLATAAVPQISSTVSSVAGGAVSKMAGTASTLVNTDGLEMMMHTAVATGAKMGGLVPYMAGTVLVDPASMMKHPVIASLFVSLFSLVGMLLYRVKRLLRQTD